MNSESDPTLPAVLVSAEPACLPSEAALRLVLDCFAQRQRGKLIRLDPIAHYTLQALNGHRRFEQDPDSVVRFFPSMYDLLRDIHASLTPMPGGDRIDDLASTRAREADLS